MSLAPIARKIDRLQLIDDESAARIESHLAVAINRHLDAPGLTPLRDAIRAYVLAGGKRIRPQLVLWTHALATGDRTLSPVVLDVAAGWELFHAFLLVHDDIIDESDTRRDRPALHRSLSSLDHGSAKFGTDLGIVAGDLLYSAAMCLWHDLDLDDARAHRDLLKLISRVACTTGFGQALDICTSHASFDSTDAIEALRACQWKTAAYTFEGPMLSGAILAGLNGSARAAISKFALAIGQAYQIQNDLDDLLKPAHAGCDVMQGKRTFTLLEHRRSLSGDQQREFDAQLDRVASSKGRGVALADCVRMQIVGGPAAFGQSHALIRSLLAEAGTAADDASLPAALKAGMERMLDRFRGHFFTAIG